MGREAYFILGFAAIVLFLVAAMRSYFLRRYRALIDPDAPNSLDDGCIRGIYMERRTEIGLVPPVHGISQPSKVQIAMETTVPVRIEAYRESMAIAVRKVAGVVGDRKLGIEDLDRRFALQFDDRPRTLSILQRAEARESLHALADLGADFVLLTSGTLTVEVPAPFVLLPRRDRIRSVMAAMRMLALVAESALSVKSPDASWEPSEVTPLRDATLEPLHTWPTSRPSARLISSPVFLATFFMAMILGFFVVGSFWDFHGTVPWETRLMTVTSRLPHLALLAGACGLLAALIVPARPILWAFRVSWPLLVHAGIVGVVYVLLRASGVSEVQQALGAELEMIPAGLGTAAAAAGAALGSGFAGAALGARLSRMSG